MHRLTLRQHLGLFVASYAVGRLLAHYNRPRVDGVTATDWRTGYFTKDRTDLPYPQPTVEFVLAACHGRV